MSKKRNIRRKGKINKTLKKTLGKIKRNKELREKPKALLYLDYIKRPLLYLHKKLVMDLDPHEEKNNFWSKVEPKTYEPNEIIPILKDYLLFIEDKIANIVSKQSVVYWLHIYRRILPQSIGRNKEPATVYLVRSTLELAFHKYGKLELCDKIGSSKDIPIDKVLNGMLLMGEFKKERESLESSDEQFVLSSFDENDLKELYNLEKLAYEIWKSTALLRIAGKGAQVIINHDPLEVEDIRSDELDFLVQTFDRRNNMTKFDRSISGVIFDSNIYTDSSIITFPFYNVYLEHYSDYYRKIGEFYGYDISNDFVPNFIWGKIDLKAYYNSHKPYAKTFFEQYGITLESLICFIYCLGFFEIIYWKMNIGYYISGIQKAYRGPVPLDIFISDMTDLMPTAKKMLGLEAETDITTLINFLTLNDNTRNKIDLEYPAFFHPFIPVNEKFYLDYAWISERLNYLFFGLKFDDENFKGDLLEDFVNKNPSLLPTRPCYNDKNDSKQIDASYGIDDILFIVECKCNGMSIGFYKGQSKAIEHRKSNIDKALQEVDNKAEWLIKYPSGKNYNISNYKKIIPIVITPFVEYIPSKDSHYWLTDNIPRVLTPNEFEDILKTDINKIKLNIREVN